MSAEAHRLVVSSTDAGKRLDAFVSDALGLSRAKARALLDEGQVRLDGRSAKKGQLVTEGQSVVVQHQEQDERPVAEPLVALSVLRSDDALVFVDKPAGLPSHPLKPGETGTLANALVARFPECADAAEAAREGGLCHRLDTDTSGVIVAARTRESWLKVREAFTERGVDKHYLALVRGPLADDGELDLPLRPARGSQRVEPAAEGGPGSREALSRFRVLSRSGDYALVDVQILTGVMHQVRAHLAAIGAPIVNDTLYGGDPEPGLNRFFLHARLLGLKHPQSGERLVVTAPLPPELQAVLAAHRLEPHA
jgi:23S rRNA pseudouridine1911/1915/1917 synthase